MPDDAGHLRRLRDLPSLYRLERVRTSNGPMVAIRCGGCRRGFRAPASDLLDDANWDFLVEHAINHRVPLARRPRPGVLKPVDNT